VTGGGCVLCFVRAHSLPSPPLTRPRPSPLPVQQSECTLGLSSGARPSTRFLHIEQKVVVRVPAVRSAWIATMKEVLPADCAPGLTLNITTRMCE
jgi:hypothetical protein